MINWFARRLVKIPLRVFGRMLGQFFFVAFEYAGQHLASKLIIVDYG